MRGKHAAPPKRRRPSTAAVVAIVMCLAIASVGLTFAWYSGTSSILNPFTKGEVDVAVNEEFDPAAGKRNVTVGVPGNDASMPAYVRAKVDVHWQDAQGNRMWESPVEKAQPANGSQSGDAAQPENPAQPEGFDYEMVWCAFAQAGTADAWVVGADGLFYWTSPVEPGAQTAPLIVSCTQNVRHDDGRVLVVDIAVQAIQCDPAQAFDESWGPHAGLAVGDAGVLVGWSESVRGGDAS